VPSGGGFGFGIAVASTAVVGTIGYVALQGLSGSSATSTLTAHSLRLASSRVSIASSALTFSAIEPKVSVLGDMARIDYSIKIENHAGRIVIWDSGQQQLNLENEQVVRGVHGTVRIAAHKSHQVTLSFDVEKNEKPIALQLELTGKRVTIKLDAGLSTPPSSPSS
jgi:hypothetical protein